MGVHPHCAQLLILLPIKGTLLPQLLYNSWTLVDFAVAFQVKLISFLFLRLLRGSYRVKETSSVNLKASVKTLLYQVRLGLIIMSELNFVSLTFQCSSLWTFFFINLFTPFQVRRLLSDYIYFNRFSHHFREFLFCTMPKQEESLMHYWPCEYRLFDILFAGMLFILRWKIHQVILCSYSIVTG